MSARTSTGKDHTKIQVELPTRTVRLLADELPANAVVLLVAPERLQPEFFPLPDGREGRCPITGKSSTWVRDRIRESQGTVHRVISHHIRARGKMRGTVLVDRASYIAFLQSHPAPAWAAGEDDNEIEQLSR